jgi:glucosamine 6-phosphate synthetase-like amidotransferase/phosphosugar isomerase protein
MGGADEAEVDVEREHGRLLEVERKGAHDDVDGDFALGHERGDKLGGADETKAFG